MDHGFVVFDNNAYKRIRPERLERIAAAERDRGIVPLASLVILQELLARVRDADAKKRGPNRAAIRKLGQHCRVTASGKTSINFLSPVDSQVYHLLAGGQHARDAEMLDAFGDLVRVVTESSPDDPLSTISADLDGIEEIVARVEEEYVTMLASAVTAERQPNQMKRNLDYAARIAARAQAFYERRFSPKEIVFRIIDMAKITSIGFALQDSIIDEIRSKGGGHGQHANSVWDEEVVSSTSMYSTINGRSLLLVTEEGRLVTAAAKVSAADRVCDLPSYERLLGLPDWVPPTGDG